MLEFCEKEDLVRIGGRSKEPKLEFCNLKYIQNSIPYGLETNREIKKKNLEISVVESKIAEISKRVQVSSFLTTIGFVDELTEEQVRSFIIEAGWGKKPMFFRVGRGHNARKTWIKQLLDDISKKYGSVTDFLHMALKVGISKNNRNGNDCMKAFKMAFQHWYPGRRELQTMKKFQTEFVLQVETCAKMSKDEDEDEDDDSGDEDYVNQLLETRMAAGEIEGVRSDDHTLFDFLDDNKKDILVKISDYPPDIVVDSQIRSVQNLWTLDDIEKLKFLYRILYDKTQKSSQELNDLLKELQSLKKRREELEITDKVKFLSQKKIIGVTITGASINHDLLHHIGPSVVIVEEAAEILEPSLLAALTSSIEHLILIGDHKQLRPQVDTYELSKNFNLDVSMMERLIESGYPFKSLAKQNRMRPEFSALLHDIYPNLEDNLPLVLKNEPLRCIEKSMFFWCHEEPEKQDRTYSNLKEAERVIAIVLYLLWNGVPTFDITVLAAYLGQTKLLRNMIKEVKKSLPHFFQTTSEHGSEQDGFIQVQTIDMYQGDENKYVIVSLVRSNKQNRIGFLKKMNRRCVAQSRAKCGMYFVGNRNTLCGAKNSCWSELINLMMKEDCVGYDFPLRCTKHETSIYKAVDEKNIWEVVKNPTLLCQQECGDFYLRCDQHPCRKTCFPLHEHNECPEILDDVFPDCGHNVKRNCPMNILYLSCTKIVCVDLPCGHQGTKACSENESTVVCREKVIKTFPRCRHTTEVPCHVKIEMTTCKQRCEENNSCGMHRCLRFCGEAHGHDICKKKIDYNFPNCGHPSLKKKECSQAITWNCKYKVIFKGSCRHEIQKECHQSEGEVKCSFTPCERLRKCKHPCPNSCGDDCEKGECEHCLRVYRKKMEESRERAKKRVKELEEKIKAQDIPNFSRDELCSTGSTAAEYQKVKDQVIKFIQPCQQWFPTITKIERVTNLELEKKFELAKSKAFGDHIDTKFHGTSNNDLTKTIKKGLKMPKDNPVPPKTRGVYGQGIYFATDPSIYARDIYAKGSQKLLLCQVILGKSLTVEEADDTLNRTKLQDKKCDSVYAPQGPKVMFEEFVIFNPHQALPRYIIHFSSTNKFVPPSPNSLTTENYFIKNMQASRSINFQDPFEMYYNFAESHFRRMAAKTGTQVTISSIDIVINKDLEDKFEETRKKFKNEGIPDQEILAYHGTDKKNIESILRSNLQLSYAKRQAYGKGNYFSEFPAVSFDYGDGLLLCRVLPGKEYVDSTNCDIPMGFNSKKVLKSQITGTSAANASGEMIIIENSDQILPFFVIHR